MKQIIDKKTKKALEELLTFTQPAGLRKSLNEVFFDFLLNNKDNLPHNFATITEDFYFLRNFLENIEQKDRNKS